MFVQEHNISDCLQELAVQTVGINSRGKVNRGLAGIRACSLAYYRSYLLTPVDTFVSGRFRSQTFRSFKPYRHLIHIVHRTELGISIFVK